jgi:phosphate transport system permease protein
MSDVTQTRLRGRERSIAGRKLKSRFIDGLMWLAGAIAVVPLVLIVGYVLARGIPALNADFFTQAAPTLGMPGGGISQALLGSALIVGVGVVISVPLGVLTAIYLSEYGRGRLASSTRFVAEILLSTPSIVAGAFIWSVVVTAMHTFSAIAASIALSVLMWPIITRGAEETLRLVPDDLREAALALGVPRWRVVLSIVLPTAGPGLFTVVMLSIARGLGETAPVLLTALGNDFVNLDPTQPTDAIPLRIYNYAQAPVEAWHQLAWGSAIVLLVVVLTLSISARILSDRQQRRLR